MTDLYVDIETFSPTELTTSNVYRYTEDPGFLILMAAWAYDDEPVQVAIGESAIRQRIPGLAAAGVRRVAYNATFERVCFSRMLGFPTGTYWAPEEWHDPMSVAGERGYPRKLAYLAQALGGELKDEAGTALINFFCKPNRYGKRNLPEDHPEKWAQFVAYCGQDVETLRSVDRALGDFPTETERQAYFADQRINDRGIEIDLDMARAAQEAAEDNRMVQELEISWKTGVENPGSGPQMLAWLRSRGVSVPNLRAETVEQLLEGTRDPTVKRVLELRQELALVASKKYTAALSSVSEDGRLRGQFQFFGAHTGRWSGRGVQLHNLPRAAFKSDLPDPDDAARDIATQTMLAILDLKMGLGADALTLKKVLRAMFVGPFGVGDYASIEARIIAWLAGEQWAMDAFAAKRDIYSETAERMSTPGNRLTRAQGKVAVLALGYNGGPPSLRAMGAEGTDAELQVLVDKWRRANPAIVGLWAEMHEAFRTGGAVGERLTIEKDEHDRQLLLPSGRAIVYHDVKWEWVTTQYGTKRQQASFADPGRPGARARTYGGRLSENATQAVARDVLAEALIRMHEAGLRVVGHVHDEVLVEDGSVEEVRRLMTEPPEWAAGMPIDGEVFRCARYRKG